MKERSWLGISCGKTMISVVPSVLTVLALICLGIEQTIWECNHNLDNFVSTISPSFNHSNNWQINGPCPAEHKTSAHHSLSTKLMFEWRWRNSFSIMSARTCPTTVKDGQKLKCNFRCCCILLKLSFIPFPSIITVKNKSTDHNQTITKNTSTCNQNTLLN